VQSLFGVEKSSIACLECVYLVLVIQHSMSIRHTVICGLSGSTIFFHISKVARFSRKVIELKMRVVMLSTNPSEKFLILRRME
jgi:hypothetical protein